MTAPRTTPAVARGGPVRARRRPRPAVAAPGPSAGASERLCASGAPAVLITVDIPGLHVASEANERGFTGDRRRTRRTSRQRSVVCLLLRSKCPRPPPAASYAVVLTRRGLGRLDGHDNLPVAFKHVVDGVSDWLGRDDADPAIRWAYRQRVVRDPREIGVEIEIYPGAGACPHCGGEGVLL